MLVGVDLAPACPGLEPEDGGGFGFPSLARGSAEQVFDTGRALHASCHRAADRGGRRQQRRRGQGLSDQTASPSDVRSAAVLLLIQPARS